MQIYVAAPYVVRDYVREWVSSLEPLGIVSNASWLLEEHEIHAGTIGVGADHDDKVVANNVAYDIAEARSADVLVLVTGSTASEFKPLTMASHPMFHTGGRHVEMGIAVATGTPIIVVGEPENVFQRALVEYVAADLPDARAYLSGMM